MSDETQDRGNGTEAGEALAEAVAAGAVAEREIEEARAKRWTGADSDAAELGLIGELLGLDVTGRTITNRPALRVGAVLVAARAAVAAIAHRQVRPPLLNSTRELEQRRHQIIETFRGPTLDGETAHRLSDERERIEVELELRTRPASFDEAAKQERAATLREVISLAPHEVGCRCSSKANGAEFDWQVHEQGCPRHQVGAMLEGRMRS